MNELPLTESINFVDTICQIKMFTNFLYLIYNVMYIFIILHVKQTFFFFLND
jgi:hypothetical protein